MTSGLLQVNTIQGGAELTIAAMDEYSRLEIGRKTYRFVRRVMQDPVLRKRVQERAAQIRAENEMDVAL